MVNYLHVEVVTENPSNVKIFQDGVALKENNFIDYLQKLGKSNWVLASSHVFMRGSYVYEKYYFMQK